MGRRQAFLDADRSLWQKLRKVFRGHRGEENQPTNELDIEGKQDQIKELRIRTQTAEAESNKCQGENQLAKDLLRVNGISTDSPGGGHAGDAATFAPGGLSTPSEHSKGDWYNSIWLEIEDVKVHRYLFGNEESFLDPRFSMESWRRHSYVCKPTESPGPNNVQPTDA